MVGDRNRGSSPDIQVCMCGYGSVKKPMSKGSHVDVSRRL